MTTGSEDHAEGPEKIDPDTLVLRGSPVRATRFRRGAIVAMAGILLSGIASVTWLALKPAMPKLPVDEAATAELNDRPSSDALAGAPESYGDVPKLGPPLPGDLGRPILAHERALEQSQGEPAVPPGEAALEQERERQLTEARSARESPVLVQMHSSTDRQSPPAAIEAANGPSETGRALLDPARDPNAQQRKIDFLARTDEGSDINSHSLAPAPSPFVLSAGSVIPASLLTGLDSDLPGLVTAQVIENVYDSPTGKVLLVPQGARLVGDYDSVVAFGQSRALVVWKRIVFPDGSSLKIDNMPATDTSGYAGLSDRIDRHTWQILKGVGLATLLGVGTELGFGQSESDLVQAIRDSAQQNAARAGEQLIGRTLDIQPTVRVRPGWPLRVLVEKDIILQPWQGGANG